MTLPFQLGTLPTLSRSTVDRQETLRTNPERLLARWPEAQVVLLDPRARTPVREGENVLATRKALTFGDTPPDDAVFLGEWQGADYWSLPGEPAGEPELLEAGGSWGFTEEIPRYDGELWVDLRAYGDKLDDTSAGLFTTAQALRNWHRAARFCARDGSATRRVQFGWASRCEAKGHEEYPRTDPAIICLVHDEVGVNGEHVLLARQPVWPKGRYSVLAGFVEAGESLEGCVTREIREEVGAEVRDVRYLGSQPWPFPRSIMLGFAARADASRPLRPADGEIEEALWVSRADVRAAFANEGGPTPIGDGAATMMLPGNSSIARVMLEAWAHAESGA
ncbi:NAD(+) diphosphatase [Amycolatopsis acidiphila]|uniref:NAD(+) diphosphatase n=1 Tax=Amycolatopsis acidiphila TaxID=715473 RepID=A0A558A187_9PSEU|nr:NAD(+) diphosphatase [Amycolatopsis acidiphila]TVT18021.1 NAD(+) diphosphatase [Amycolatopsis acidiphila]UIJ61026.1 NAD(+) diphosphatase [Amycolatopsis acidiphila]GHG88941.1 NADH pyrophosphatase [Amycolatopsis acidiphila]